MDELQCDLGELLFRVWIGEHREEAILTQTQIEFIACESRNTKMVISEEDMGTWLPKGLLCF